MNKLSMVGMQLHEKYKENIDVSSQGPSSLHLDRFSKFPVAIKGSLII